MQHVQAAYGNLSGFKAELAEAVRQCGVDGGAAEEAEPLDRAPLEGDEWDPWLLVTRPTQLAAVDGNLRLRRGLDKSTLPGFAELNPGGRNAFYVLYKYKDRFFELEGGPPFPSDIPMRITHMCHATLATIPAPMTKKCHYPQGDVITQM